MPQFPPEVYALIDAAIAEDQTFNDPTTAAVVPPEIRGVGMLRAKAHGVLAGVEVGLAVFRRVEPELELEALLSDGAALAPGDGIARVAGPAAGILQAERIALNFMQRMSGIASLTNRYVRAVEGTRSRIVDTRKTAPGHRYLDKYAVRAGGGYNHRYNLADGILIKDNHIEANRFREMGLRQVIELALERASHTIRVEVEVESLEAAREGAGRRGSHHHAGQYAGGHDARGHGLHRRQGRGRGVGRHQLRHRSRRGRNRRTSHIHRRTDSLDVCPGHQPRLGI